MISSETEDPDTEDSDTEDPDIGDETEDPDTEEFRRREADPRKTAVLFSEKMRVRRQMISFSPALPALTSFLSDPGTVSADFSLFMYPAL
jgi:hypothetical protein